MERTIERLLFASRWILAPVYLGLSLALFALGIKFFMELWHLMTHVPFEDEAGVVLALLAMVDLVLVGTLIVMVMFSGYENFVSQLDVGEGSEKLAGQARRELTQAESCILDRCDLIDPPAAPVHESGPGGAGHAHVVRDHPPHVRRLGRDDGRARPDHFGAAPGP